MKTKSNIDLQLEYLKLKSASYDHVTGIPVTNIFYKDLVKLLDRKNRVACFLITMVNGGEIEKGLSFELYDKLLAEISKEIVEALKALGIREYMLASSAPGGETFFAFVVEDPPEIVINTDFIENTKTALNDRLTAKFSGFIKSENLPILVPYILVLGKKLEGTATIRGERQLSRELDSLRVEVARISETAEYDKRILIKRMIDSRAVQIVFQPIVNAKEKTVFGYEALARGVDGQEFHDPETFLSLAQKYDMLKEIESVCVMNALDTLFKALKGNKKMINKKLFINLSPPSFPVLLSDEFTQALKEYGLSPNQIVIELTEKFSSTVPHENEVYFDIIKRISKQGGFEIAVDDVGTGYSTLERIAALNPQYIKYDRVLFKNVYRDPLKQELLKTILDFSRKINSHLIVEGVDNNQDYDFAIKLGVQYMQGFLFGRPLRFTR